MNQPISSDATKDRASLPSLIQSFTIEGLYGYRTIGLSSNFAAAVLIAKNGSGKTTLLAALDAFLRGQFLRLASLDFTKIVCKLETFPLPLSISKEDIDSLSAFDKDAYLNSTAKAFGINPTELNEFIQNDILPLGRITRDISSNPTFKSIYQKMGYRFAEAKSHCEQLASAAKSQCPHIQELREILRIALGDTEIVYLPTYRRIELPLSDKRSDDSYAPELPSIQSRLGLSRNSLHTTTIQFGLADISDRLDKLNKEILFNSDRGYRRISANIINELIDGALEYDNSDNAPLPKKEALELFFSRLKQGSTRRDLSGPFEVAIPNIEKIYRVGDIPQQSDRFLKYFLRKLNEVISATRTIELMVEEFVTNCNRYLCTNDQLDNEERQHAKHRRLDDKALTFNPRNFQIGVISLYSGTPIPLEALSSGEKQMISLFANLYLYPAKKIVLIDEPELSLSIGWQRRILLDIVSAPSCIQTIAITHSPFVFDNSLEPYAKTLELDLLDQISPDLFPSDPDDSLFHEEDINDE